MTVDVKLMPGLEHLPFAEVWFSSIDEQRWRQASSAARALGKNGLEVWTTTETPDVVAFFARRGYDEVRRYVVSALDMAVAPELSPAEVLPQGWEIATFAERPDLARALFEVALESYPDQPGRSEQVIESFESWRHWGLDGHPPDAFLIVLEGGHVLGYGLLEIDGDTGRHGFTAVARAERGRGVARALKRAQVAWAAENGLRRLQTANETRLAGMRALNTRHGYVPLYDEIVLRGPAATVESPS